MQKPDRTASCRLYTRGGIMPDHPAGARRVFLRVANEVGVAVHEHTGVQEVCGNATRTMRCQNQLYVRHWS